MEIKIRQIKKQDFSRVVELTNEAYTIPYKLGKKTTNANDSIDKIKSDLMEKGVIMVAESEAEIIGAVRCKKIENSILLYKLAVDASFRRLGVGRRLVEFIFQWSKNEGASKIMIEVAEKKGLIPYYESLGFIVTRRYFNKDHYEVEMSKSLG
jgi:predicted N-acetyltransferase YhbS